MVRSKLLLFVMAAGGLHATGDSTLDRATLRGIPAVNVVIDAIDAAVEKEGVTREALRGRVEYQLRAANITMDSSRPEFVAVRLTSVRDTRGPFAVAITISLYQPVQLVRDPTVRTAIGTWEVETVVLADPKVLYRACQESLDDLASRFVTAYRSVNPAAAK
jgi:hypothetical protein